MSDAQAPEPTGDPVPNDVIAAAVSDIPPPPATPPEPETSAPEGDDWYNDQGKVKAYIKELRDEAAGARVKAKPYTDTFGNFNESEQSYLLNVMQMAASQNPDERAKAAEEFSYLATQMGGGTPPEPEPPAEAPAAESAPAASEVLTEDDIAKIIAGELAGADRKRNVAAQVAVVKEKAAEAGYPEGTIEYDALLATARRHNYSIETAITEYKKAEQAKIDAFVAEQRGQGSRFPTQSGAAATPPPSGGEETSRTIKETSDAVRAWMASRSGG